jgi:hypothetical protein
MLVSLASQGTVVELQLVVVAVEEQAQSAGATVGCCNCVGSRWAACIALSTALQAFADGLFEPPHVVQTGATAARAPSRAARVIVP